MNTTVKTENKIIPYKMLLNAMETTHELVEKILPETGIPSLKIGLEEMISAVRKDIERTKEGVPIVGYHFAGVSDGLFSLSPVGTVSTHFNFAYFFKRDTAGSPTLLEIRAHVIFCFFKGVHGIRVR